MEDYIKYNNTRKYLSDNNIIWNTPITVWSITVSIFWLDDWWPKVFNDLTPTEQTDVITAIQTLVAPYSTWQYSQQVMDIRDVPAYVSWLSYSEIYFVPWMNLNHVWVLHKI